MSKIVYSLISIAALSGAFFFGYYWHPNNTQRLNVTLSAGDTLNIPNGASGYVGLGKMLDSNLYTGNAQIHYPIFVTGDVRVKGRLFALDSAYVTCAPYTFDTVRSNPWSGDRLHYSNTYYPSKKWAYYYWTYNTKHISAWGEDNIAISREITKEDIINRIKMFGLGTYHDHIIKVDIRYYDSEDEFLANNPPEEAMWRSFIEYNRIKEALK